MINTPTVPAYEMWTKEMLIQEREKYYNLVKEAIDSRYILTQEDLQNTKALEYAFKRFQ